MHQTTLWFLEISSSDQSQPTSSEGREGRHRPPLLGAGEEATMSGSEEEPAAVRGGRRGSNA